MYHGWQLLILPYDVKVQIFKVSGTTLGIGEEEDFSTFPSKFNQIFILAVNQRI